MKQITQKFESHSSGGFSDTRLRFYILGFMSLGLIMAPFLGMIASFIVVLIFGIFTAVKINEFQENNPVSILLYRQAMDRMYHNSVDAKYYEEMLRPYEERNATKKAINYQKTKQVNHTDSLQLALSV